MIGDTGGRIGMNQRAHGVPRNPADAIAIKPLLVHGASVRRASYVSILQGRLVLASRRPDVEQRQPQSVSHDRVPRTTPWLRPPASGRQPPTIGENRRTRELEWANPDPSI